MPVSPDAGDLPEMRRGGAYGGSLAARAKELNRRVGFAAVPRADFSTSVLHAAPTNTGLPFLTRATAR